MNDKELYKHIQRIGCVLEDAQPFEKTTRFTEFVVIQKITPKVKPQIKSNRGTFNCINHQGAFLTPYWWFRINKIDKEGRIVKGIIRFGKKEYKILIDKEGFINDNF